MNDDKKQGEEEEKREIEAEEIFRKIMTDSFLNLMKYISQHIQEAL